MTSPSETLDWLVQFVADVLDVGTSEVDTGAPWAELGVDSATILVLVADLERDRGLAVRPAEVLDHPSIDALTAHLSAAHPVEV